MTGQQIRRAARLYRAGRTLPEIAETLGYLPGADRYVWRQIRDRVQIRRTGPRGRVQVRDEDIVAMRGEPGGAPLATWGEIAEQVGMSRSGVRARYLRATQGWRWR